MTTRKQKNHELFYAEQAAKLLNQDWEITLGPDERDYVDLIVKYNNNIFGLEVRDIFIDENMHDLRKKKYSIKKQQESKNCKQVSKLAKAYYSKTSTPIMLKIAGGDIFDNNIVDYLIELSGQLSLNEAIYIENDIWKLFIRILPPGFKN